MLNPQLQQHLELYDGPRDEVEEHSASSADPSPLPEVCASSDLESKRSQILSTIVAALIGFTASSLIGWTTSSPSDVYSATSLISLPLLSLSLVVVMAVAWMYGFPTRYSYLSRIEKPLHEDVGYRMCDAELMEMRHSLSRLLGSVGAPPLNSVSSGRLVDRVDRPFHLELLEHFTREHVELIRLVDELIELIKTATMVRFGLTCTFTTPTALFSRSVERVERSTASRLLKRGHVFALPLSTLRRNLSPILLRQLESLCQCVVGDTTETESLLDMPPIPTISWLRSVRNDISRILSNIVDNTLIAVEQTTTTGEISDSGTVVDAVAMRRALSSASEALAYLQASLPTGSTASVEHAVKNNFSSEDQDQSQLRLLQQQSNLLLSAILSWQDALLVEGMDRQLWWTKIMDLSSQMSITIQNIDSVLFQDGSKDLQSENDETSGCEMEQETQAPVGHNEEEYVVVHQEREKTMLDSNQTDQGANTLVYSGKGSIIQKSSSRSPKANASGTTNSGITSACLQRDDAVMHHSLIQELQGRLDVIHPEEVDANSLSLEDDEFDKEKRGREVMISPLDTHSRLLAPVLFLGELQGAMQSVASAPEVDYSDRSE